jgi:hypothetical protein
VGTIRAGNAASSQLLYQTLKSPQRGASTDYCTVFTECLPLHILNFLIALTQISMIFYAITGVAALFIRLIQMFENFRGKDQ